MVKVTAIKPLSDFVRNTRSHIKRLKSSQQPEVLTVNGEAAVVIQDAASYEKMAALAEQAQQDARLLAALESFRRGEKGEPADDVFKNLARKHL
jgi:PHD/YefM family antitoxin component YafN of YafNO toxin-antitoxin module